MIAIFARLVGPKLAPFAAYGLLVVAALAALWWVRHDAYRDGVRATDAKWEAASAALQKRALEASNNASSKSDARAADYLEKVEQVKDKLDEAQQNGSSSLDVLFGPGDSGL